MLDSEITTESATESEVVEAGNSVNPEESLKGLTQEQQREAEMFALTFIKKILRLRGVRIDRSQFLTAELQKRGYSLDVIHRAIESTPAGAGVTLTVLDEVATSAVDFETRKSSSLSFAAGLPGGFAMFGTIPADITQFYVHAFRVMQKLAYIYGWQSFLEETEDIDDESLGILTTFLGVMMGVGGASASLTSFAANVATPAVQRNIARVALTKTAWYGPMKKTLKIIGINVTKQSFAKSVSKVVPVVGVVISGGLTYVVLGSQARRLQKHLRTLPPPNIDAAEYLALLEDVVEVSKDKKPRVPSALSSAGSSIKSAATGTVDFFRAVDLDGDGVPDESRAKTTVKNAMTAAKNAVKRPDNTESQQTNVDVPENDTRNRRKLRGTVVSAGGMFKNKRSFRHDGNPEVPGSEADIANETE